MTIHLNPWLLSVVIKTMTMIGQRFYILPGNPPRTGGTASVHKARDTQTDCLAAIKLFDGTDFEDELLKELFLRDTEALTALNHPNIVKMIGAGYDNTLNKHFIALEWIDEVLRQYLKENSVESWDAFCDSILMPVLSGLAEAHARQIIHRDIKPSNILVASDGQPKLADFGIAKIVNSMRFGLTVREFRSTPFSPPDYARNDPSPRDDIFSLGITILDCLKRDPNLIISHDKLEDAVQNCSLPEDGERFVRRLINFNVDERPYNAAVALAELERIRRNRPQNTAPRGKYYLFVHPDKSDLIRKLLRVPDSDDLNKAIRRDLSEATAISPHKSKELNPLGLNFYRLLGKELYYIVNAMPGGEYSNGVLVISDAYRQEKWMMEAQREKYLSVVADFVFANPISIVNAREELQQLFVSVAEHVGRREREEVEEDERQIFWRWKSILRLKRDIELGKADALEYQSYSINGQRVKFVLTQAPENDLRDQYRCVQTRQQPVCGTIEDVVDNELLMFVQSGNPTTLPSKSYLKFEVDMSESAIKRQEKALEEIARGRSARDDLKSLLVHPEKAQHPNPVINLSPLQELDTPKWSALTTALGSPDFTVVQGPPGTGKTTWIAELICQFLEYKPGGRIILSAQTHIAVDNALEKVKRIRPHLRIIRVGHTDKIAESVESYRIQPQMEMWATKVRVASEDFLLNWAEQHGISDAEMALNDKVENLDQIESQIASSDEKETLLRQRCQELQGLRDEIASMEEKVWAQADQADKFRLEDAFQDTPALISTANSYVDLGFQLLEKLNLAADLSRDAFGLQEELDEIQKTTMSYHRTRDMLRDEIVEKLADETLRNASLSTLRRTVQSTLAAKDADTKKLNLLQKIQQEWLTRFGHGEGFEQALVSVADVVAGTCIGIAGAGRLDDTVFDLAIIDEASKATPTEALVAMTRATQWVLVGDQKQLPPFTEQELQQQQKLAKYDLTKNQIEETLFDRLIIAAPPLCQPRLTVQHRMVPAIGDLISTCFYDGELQTSPTVLLQQSVDKQMLVSQILPKPVTWYSTSRLINKHEREERSRDAQSLSYSNLEEAVRIREWLEELRHHVVSRNLSLSVGVISGYTAQKNLLAKEIDPLDKQRWQNLTIEINSVDAFQGREVDISVYSSTRSNRQGEIGFLRSEKRLNVALSRGRDALVIFGDAEHCRNVAVANNPFRLVLDYIDSHSESCCLENF